MEGLCDDEGVMDYGHLFYSAKMMRMYRVSARFQSENLTRKKIEGNYNAFSHAHQVALSRFIDRIFWACAKLLVAHEGVTLGTERRKRFVEGGKKRMTSV